MGVPSVLPHAHSCCRLAVACSALQAAIKAGVELLQLGQWSPKGAGAFLISCFYNSDAPSIPAGARETALATVQVSGRLWMVRGECTRVWQREPS